jgi:hypothetical protein
MLVSLKLHCRHILAHNLFIRLTCLSVFYSLIIKFGAKYDDNFNVSSIFLASRSKYFPKHEFTVFLRYFFLRFGAGIKKPPPSTHIKPSPSFVASSITHQKINSFPIN